jgi:zinc transport system permease protein
MPARKTDVHFLSEPLSQPFLQRALVAGVLCGLLCAPLGVLVVQRGLAFLADGLAHATFGGIALGLAFGLAPERALWTALPFTILVALGVGALERRAGLRGDAAVGIFFAVSFAGGVLLLGLRPATAPAVSAEALLFGSVLAVTPDLLRGLVPFAALIGLILVLTWSRLAYATFDRDLARLSGVPVDRLEALFMIMTAAVIVVSVRTVGVFLVGSFLIIPAATAQLLCRTLARSTLAALAIGPAGAAIGLIASYHLNLASGATIILGLGAAFAAALPFRHRS